MGRTCSQPRRVVQYNRVQGRSHHAVGFARSETVNEMDELKEFLKDNLDSFEFSRLVDNIDDDLETYVDDNFEFFNETLLRKLIAVALKVRDENVTKGLQNSDQVMGPWTKVIDVVRSVTDVRQQRAGRIFQEVVAIAEKEGAKQTQKVLTALYRQKQIDNVFIDLVREGIQRASTSGHVESAEMLKFFDKVIQTNITVEKALIAKGKEDKSSSSSVTSAIPTKELTKEKESSESSESDRKASSSENDEQSKLVIASDYLRSMISQAKGDAGSLQKRICRDLMDGELPFSLEEFQRVVTDNIQASEQAGYMNRVKLLKFIETNCIQKVTVAIEESEITGNTTYHAPKFIDDLMNKDNSGTKTIEGSSLEDMMRVLAPESFISGFPTDAQVTKKLSKTGQLLKNRDMEKQAAKDFQDMTGEISTHLSTHGWAVCDNFISPDLVRRVRIEADLFDDHYEQSEIWVGKQADVGTLLSVPSVRGDKVIWMCGGHNHKLSPEGESRFVKTKGEIEPCKMEAKARAPMRKFTALKEIVGSCDKLMEEMKRKVDRLSGVYERSDVMLANYPGGGSRFARHIDNTTGDGRRLTMLVYLNPNWDTEKGGALRLTPSECDKYSEVNKEVADATDVFPQCGRIAMFFSADIPHEVRPTYGNRHALTIWYYDRDERKKAVEESKESGKAKEVSMAGTDAQREAKEFIADLMGGDEVEVDGGEPSMEELGALSNKVVDLSDAALGVVASITGAPSTESFREGFTQLTPTDLKSMRQLFRRMGLAEQTV